MTEDNSLHTEIEVDNMTSNDQVFVDVFSGDQDAGVEAADTVFISFENENGTVKSVRIGIEDERGRGIDNIVVLDGISAHTPVDNDSTEPASAESQDSLSDSLLAFDQIKSPITVITPDGRYMYFEDGRAVKKQIFSKDYGIGEVRAVRDEIEIRLIEK